MTVFKAEYIWVDGTAPDALLRSKTKILEGNTDPTLKIELKGVEDEVI